jgi:hypothetical protein
MQTLTEKLGEHMAKGAIRIRRLTTLQTFTDEAVRSDTALNGAALNEPALAQDWLRDASAHSTRSLLT